MYPLTTPNKPKTLGTPPNCSPGPPNIPELGIQCIYIEGGVIMATSMVHIRVDEKVKAKAAKTLAAMGLTVSDAVRLLLTRVAAEKALPFDVRVPNRETVAAMEAGERGQVRKATSVAAMMAELNAHR